MSAAEMAKAYAGALATLLATITTAVATAGLDVSNPWLIGLIVALSVVGAGLLVYYVPNDTGTNDQLNYERGYKHGQQGVAPQDPRGPADPTGRVDHMGRVERQPDGSMGMIGQAPPDDYDDKGRYRPGAAKRHRNDW